MKTTFLIATLLSINVWVQAQDKPILYLDFSIAPESFIAENFAEELESMESDAASAMRKIMSNYLGFVNFSDDQSLDQKVNLVLEPESGRRQSSDLEKHVMTIVFSSGPLLISQKKIPMLNMLELANLGDAETFINLLVSKLETYLRGQHKMVAREIFEDLVLTDRLLLLDSGKEWVIPFPEDDLLIDTEASSFRIQIEGQDNHGSCVFSITAKCSGTYSTDNPIDPLFLNCIRARSEDDFNEDCDHGFTKLYIDQYVRRLEPVSREETESIESFIESIGG